MMNLLNKSNWGIHLTKAPPTYSTYSYGRFPKNTTCCSHLSQVNTPNKSI